MRKEYVNIKATVVEGRRPHRYIIQRQSYHSLFLAIVCTLGQLLLLSQSALAHGTSSSSAAAFVSSRHYKRYRPHPRRSLQQQSSTRSRSTTVESPFSLLFFNANANSNNNVIQYTKSNILVQIERTSPNSRRISGEMILSNDIPLNDIWSVLTDYDNLSDHVPNLVESRVVGYTASTTGGGRSEGGSPMVYQRGAQRIFGFEFGADLTMEMSECIVDDVGLGIQQPLMDQVADVIPTRTRTLDFKCVDSLFFARFDGSWIVEELTSATSSNQKIIAVRYVVDIVPKGVVPVAALEWRIKEDVPVNMLGVSSAARRRREIRRGREQLDDDVVTSSYTKSSSVSDAVRVGANPGFVGNALVASGIEKSSSSVEWYKDETMAMYLN
eukprot:g3709.t1 g3709   contig12:2622996-2624147(+)